MTDFKKDLKNGQTFEKSFRSMMSKKYNIQIERADKKVTKNPDYKSITYFECKKLREPFRNSKKYLGLEPSKTFALDVAKLEKYKRKRHPVFIVFDVDFRPKYDTNGLYVITIQKLRKLFKEHPERVFKRSSDDPEHNACVKFHVALEECIPFEDIFGE